MAANGYLWRFRSCFLAFGCLGPSPEAVSSPTFPTNPTFTLFPAGKNPKPGKVGDFPPCGKQKSHSTLVRAGSFETRAL